MGFDEQLFSFLLLSGAVDWEIQINPLIKNKEFGISPTCVHIKVNAYFREVLDYRTLTPTDEDEGYFQSYLEGWDDIQAYTLRIQPVPSIPKSSFIKVKGAIFAHPHTDLHTHRNSVIEVIGRVNASPELYVSHSTFY